MSRTRSRRHAPSAPTLLRFVGALLPVLLLAVGASVVGRPLAAPARADAAGIPEIEAACESANPFFVASGVAGSEDPRRDPGSAAVVVFRGAPGGGTAPQTTVATQADVGSAYGLAYDVGRRHLYAAAYHKRMVPFGPGGPGTIYRIDMATGDVAPWVDLDAGPDRHGFGDRHDEPAATWVGRTSLADIDLDEDAGNLFVANLYSARIYRLSVPDGAILGSFRHGAPEHWKRSARLFGLAYHDGWLYHGVTNIEGSSQPGNPPSEYPFGYVYRSRPDGTEMREIARFELSWTVGSGHRQSVVGFDHRVADIEIRPGGDPVIGLRSRQLDAEQVPYWVVAGAVLKGSVVGNRWEMPRGPLPFDFGATMYARNATGGLAMFPGLDHLVSPAIALDAGYEGGTRSELRQTAQVLWFDNSSGDRTRLETLVRYSSPYLEAAPIGLGDVESMCARGTAIDPDLVATSTQEVIVAGTATAGARATQLLATHTAAAATAENRLTAVAATATAAAGTGTPVAPRTLGTPEIVHTLTSVAAKMTAVAPTQRAIASVVAAATPAPAETATAAAEGYARITRSCSTDNPFLAMASLIPALDYSGQPHSKRVMEHAPVVLGFNDTAAEDPDDHLVLALEPQVGAVHGLAYDWRRGHLYVSAYHKRLARYGPLGPGGIYRMDLTTGSVLPWFALDSGPDRHRWDAGLDVSAVPGVGRSSFGDIEIDEAGTTLFAANLYDRLIYRFSVPDGEFLGAFAHGASREPWAIGARPFGLGFRDGRLFHGVVDSGKWQGPRWPLLGGYIYRSLPDGSEMEEVVSFDLEYERGLSSFFRWQAWADGSHPTGAMLSDIEFRLDGDPIIGLRNRSGDGLLAVGDGDIVPTLPIGNRWMAWPFPEHYQDMVVHDEAAWGSLAAVPGLDSVVTSFLDPWVPNSGGAVWYDSFSGLFTRRETVYLYGPNTPTFGKSAGLGDIEVLCPPLSPTPTSTPTPSPTLTPTPTPSSTPSPVPTATPRPRPIFVPLVLSESCDARHVHADVVLVIDASTSMRRDTGDGRPKLEAVQDAARIFIGRMDFTPNDDGVHDQVAIVGFNDSAWTEQPLSADESGLRAAVARLPDRVATGTRLDLALRQGTVALQHVARITDNTPVIVLLTDGLPNRVPTPAPDGRQEDTVLSEAQRTKESGVRIYTVGVGRPDAPDIADRINAWLLAEVASTPEMFYQTVRADELANIYAEIAYTIGCPPDRFWGRRP